MQRMMFSLYLILLPRKQILPLLENTAPTHPKKRPEEHLVLVTPQVHLLNPSLSQSNIHGNMGFSPVQERIAYIKSVVKKLNLLNLSSPLVSLLQDFRRWFQRNVPSCYSCFIFRHKSKGKSKKQGFDLLPHQTRSKVSLVKLELDTIKIMHQGGESGSWLTARLVHNYGTMPWLV